MAFIQVIDYKTSQPEEVKRVIDEWEEATKGKRTANRLLLTKYHDEPDRYCEIVFFDSYDEAMKNSELPETQEFAGRFSELVDGDTRYFDLDVVEERSL